MAPEARQRAAVSSANRLASHRITQEAPKALQLRAGSSGSSLQLEEQDRQDLSLAARPQLLQAVSSPSQAQEAVPSAKVAPKTRRTKTQAAASLATSPPVEPEAACLAEAPAQEAVEVYSVAVPSQSLASSDRLAPLRLQLACSASHQHHQQVVAFLEQDRHRVSQAPDFLAVSKAQ